MKKTLQNIALAGILALSACVPEKLVHNNKIYKQLEAASAYQGVISPNSEYKLIVDGKETYSRLNFLASNNYDYDYAASRSTLTFRVGETTVTLNGEGHIGANRNGVDITDEETLKSAKDLANKVLSAYVSVGQTIISNRDYSAAIGAKKDLSPAVEESSK